MRNLYCSIVAWVCVSLFANGSFAQEKIWFAAGSVSYCDTDGTNMGAATGLDAGFMMQASTGDIFVVTNSGGEEDYGSIYRISPIGIQKITDLGYNMQNAFMTEGKDGYIYGVKPSAFDYFLFRFKLDGTGHEEKYFGTYGMQESELTTSLTGDIIGTSMFHLYKFKPDMTGIIKLYAYQKATGNRPIGKVHQSGDGYLYGVTRLGGAGNYGVIYRVKPTGTDYTVLHEFNITNGRYPDRGLAESADGYLYGVTSAGGKYHSGVLFRIKRDGSGYEILHHFSATDPHADGAYPMSVQIDKFGNLYGSPPGYYGRAMFKFDMSTKTYSTPIIGDMTINHINLFKEVAPAIEVLRPVNGATNVLVNDTHRVTFIPGSFWYTIEFSTVSDFSSNVLTSTYASSSNLPRVNLAYNTKYYARAKSSLWPYYGKTISFTTRTAESYGWVTNPKDGSVDIEASTLKVTGNLVPYAKRYTIQLSKTSDFSSGVITKISAIDNQRTLIFTGLAYATKYYARMKTDISGYGRITSFTTKADPEAAMAMMAEEESMIDVHPNPSSSFFNVSIRKSPGYMARVVMTRLTGDVVEDLKVRPGDVVRLGNNVEKGIYIVRIATPEGVEVRRVVKE